MIARGLGPILESRITGSAIGAFTTYSLESTRAICDVADEMERSVIVQAGSSSFRGVGRTPLAAAALAMARAARQPIGVHLDHSTDLEEIRACLELGYSSVMIDGSHEDFELNVALTAEVVKEAHAVGAWVEGELGALAGHEDISTFTRSGEFTDPSRAAEFVERTNVDVLAVAIGSVHGIPRVPVTLDLELLALIARQVEIPLALHGASGLDPSQLWGAVQLGMAKVNFNAELRHAYLSGFADALQEGSDDVVAVQCAAVRSVADVVREKIALLHFGPPG